MDSNNKQLVMIYQQVLQQVLHCTLSGMDDVMAERFLSDKMLNEPVESAQYNYKKTMDVASD